MADNEFNDYKHIDDNLTNAKDEFSELDYRPKKGLVMIKSGLIIIVAIIALIMSVIYFGDSSFQAVVDEGEQENVNGENGEPENDKPADEKVDEPGQNNEEAVDQDNDNGKEGEGIEDVADPGTADPAKLEPVLKTWIVERTADPQIILLSDDELEDVEGFFEEYDLENENIVVYKVDSIDDEFATVLFGIPFSEWTIKAVFTWRDGKWVFLREEPV